MTKPLAADSTLFLALSSCDVPRDLADRVQQRCKLPDVVASKVVLWSRADRIGGIRETATNLFVAGALTKAAWNEVLASASAAVDQLNIAALNAA